MPSFDEILAIRVMAMPRDTNIHGTIFGGFILSLIDQAGAIAVNAAGAKRVVTVAMDHVDFQEPVHVGDLVTCFARVVKRGRTSLSVRVRVVAQAPSGDAEREVTVAGVTYVQISDDGKPKPL